MSLCFEDRSRCFGGAYFFNLVAKEMCFSETDVNFLPGYITLYGPSSSVGIATGYGLDGPGIESRWEGGEIFRTCPDRPWSPPSLL
jgi:hypothetical protein